MEFFAGSAAMHGAAENMVSNKAMIDELVRMMNVSLIVENIRVTFRGGCYVGSNF
jgi:hypothetical protein